MERLGEEAPGLPCHQFGRAPGDRAMAPVRVDASSGRETLIPGPSPRTATGSQRYRKPCKAFFLALQHGCNWTMNVGDLSFAEPPDCFELPIRAYTEAEYLDAAALGAEGEADSGGRADDILKIAALLEDEALTEHAVFMYLQALRYRSDDTAVCQ